MGSCFLRFRIGTIPKLQPIVKSSYFGSFQRLKDTSTQSDQENRKTNPGRLGSYMSISCEMGSNMSGGCEGGSNMSRGCEMGSNMSADCEGGSNESRGAQGGSKVSGDYEGDSNLSSGKTNRKNRKADLGRGNAILIAALGLLKAAEMEDPDEDFVGAEHEDPYGDDLEDHEIPDKLPVINIESQSNCCTFCGASLIIVEQSKKKKAVMSIYTRDGTIFARHLVKRCLNSSCRAGHFLGYTVKDNIRRYDPDVLQTTKYLGKISYRNWT